MDRSPIKGMMRIVMNKNPTIKHPEFNEVLRLYSEDPDVFPALYHGYNSKINGEPFSNQYETRSEIYQRNYEFGRLVATEAIRAGLKVSWEAPLPVPEQLMRFIE